MGLDQDTKTFTAAVQHAARSIERLYRNLEQKNVYPGRSPAEVQARFAEPLPDEGIPLGELLDKIEAEVFESATLNVGPHFYGYITGGGNQAAVLGEMLKAALNQNNLKWHSSPVSTELEKLVARWVAEFVGYPEDAAGVLLDGGSVANFESLAVARKIKAPVDLANEGLYNAPPLTIYVSEEGHSSFDKAVDMLGLGRKYLRKIPVDEEFRIRVEELEKRIREDRREGRHPICAIGIAGTTNTGAVDDLQALARVCRKYDLWYHVDAAYGGPAAGLESVGAAFSGIELADSLVVNPHKWMYVPFGAACVLVKNPEHMRRTFSTIPDYLKSDRSGQERTDLMEYNLPLTKDFKALKVWMTVKAYGARKLREMVQADIDKASYLADRIRKSGLFELLAPAPLSIVCFRYRPPELPESGLNLLNQKLIQELERDGRIFLAGTKIRDMEALRVCFINHRTGMQHIDRLMDVVDEVGRKIAGEMSTP